ncbi:hypothetical protein OROMI_013233 [Orobanche minor]
MERLYRDYEKEFGDNGTHDLSLLHKLRILVCLR